MIDYNNIYPSRIDEENEPREWYSQQVAPVKGIDAFIAKEEKGINKLLQWLGKRIKW